MVYWVDPVAFAGGSASVLLLCALVLALPTIAKASGLFSLDDDGAGEPLEYIEARLLKYGEIKDKEALPDRIVPALPTAPEEVVPLDRDAQKPEPKVKTVKEKPQSDAVLDDKLRQVFDKARAFAEIQDEYVPEGHPDGVPDGDVTDPALASIGATYLHRIRRIINERWRVPTLIPEGELKTLKARMLLRFDIDMTISRVKFLKRSGNRLFDDSAQNAIDRVRQEVRTLPDPPEAIAGRIFDTGIVMNFNGADAQYE